MESIKYFFRLFFENWNQLNFKSLGIYFLYVHPLIFYIYVVSGFVSAEFTVGQFNSYLQEKRRTIALIMLVSPKITFVSPFTIITNDICFTFGQPTAVPLSTKSFGMIKLSLGSDKIVVKNLVKLIFVQQVASLTTSEKFRENIVFTKILIFY